MAQHATLLRQAQLRAAALRYLTDAHVWRADRKQVAELHRGRDVTIFQDATSHETALRLADEINFFNFCIEVALFEEFAGGIGLFFHGTDDAILIAVNMRLIQARFELTDEHLVLWKVAR